MTDYDIVIVGAGPAGASAAFFSKFFDKDKQHRVLLLDALREPTYSAYYHICGKVVSRVQM